MSEDDRFDSLLQGRDAWWHFMELQAQAPPEAASSADAPPALELEEVGRWAQRQRAQARPRFQPHFTASLRCRACHAQVPADLTFCVYCGAAPGYSADARPQLMAIAQVQDPDVFSEVVDLLIQSNSGLDAREVWSALAQPPAVFLFNGQDEHAQALVDRLGELGVVASITHPEDATSLMPREIIESVLRRRRDLTLWLALLASVVGLMFLSWKLAALLLILAAPALATYHARRFSQRYAIDVVQILNALTGLDSALATRCQAALRALSEQPEVRDLLTVCLMEYYAIWRHLAAARPELRRLLGPLKGGLDDLLANLADGCARYAQIAHYVASVDAPKLSAQIAALEADPDHDARTLRARLEQQQTLERAALALPALKRRLGAMAASLEALRARVMAMTLSRASVEAGEGAIFDLLSALDDEVVIFEQTLDTVNAPA